LNFSREATLTLNNPTINNHMLYQIMGYKFIENIHMVDRTQNRKHRHKRINKKWAKRYGFTVTPKKDVYVMGNQIIGHPSVLKTFKETEEAKFRQ
jgi:hypothetical protein